jgi:magnesium chelatase subunit D
MLSNGSELPNAASHMIETPAFCVHAADQSNRARIIRARRNFANVKIAHALLRQMVEMCIAVKVDGHRGELTLMRSSRALAAFEGRKKVTEADVRRVAAMCLRHRLRRNAFEETVSDEVISQVVDSQFTDKGAQGTGEKGEYAEPNSAVREFPSPPAGGVTKLRIESNGVPHQGESSGKHSKRNQKTLNKDRGRHSRSVSNRRLATKVALAATVQAIASLGASLGQRPKSGLTPVDADSIRYKLLSRKHGALFIFAIDTSGSMAARRIALAKRIMLDRLRQAYVNRDRIAIISFRGTSGD